MHGIAHEENPPVTQFSSPQQVGKSLRINLRRLARVSRPRPDLRSVNTKEASTPGLPEGRKASAVRPKWANQPWGVPLKDLEYRSHRRPWEQRVYIRWQAKFKNNADAQCRYHRHDHCPAKVWIRPLNCDANRWRIWPASPCNSQVSGDSSWGEALKLRAGCRIDVSPGSPPPLNRPPAHTNAGCVG